MYTLHVYMHIHVQAAALDRACGCDCHETHALLADLLRLSDTPRLAVAPLQVCMYALHAHVNMSMHTPRLALAPLQVCMYTCIHVYAHG